MRAGPRQSAHGPYVWRKNFRIITSFYLEFGNKNDPIIQLASSDDEVKFFPPISLSTHSYIPPCNEWKIILATPDRFHISMLAPHNVHELAYILIPLLGPVKHEQYCCLVGC